MGVTAAIAAPETALFRGVSAMLKGGTRWVSQSHLFYIDFSMKSEVLTLRAGLERYYAANPNFVRNQDLQVGRLRIPWQDMLRHDIMHVVTGYSTQLDQELRLIGFLLTALTWKRPWYYYAQSFVVFLELLAMSLQGKAFGDRYYNPYQVCRMYIQGVRQGFTVRQKINAYIDPETVMDCPLAKLRSDYGIASAGAWDAASEGRS